MSKKSVRKKSIVVGVTGQLATGKSTVAAMLADLGAGVINADVLAHRALRPAEGCFQKVVRVFGPEIVTRGQIDRKKLAAIVFNNPSQLKKLEAIIHPVVARETRKQILLLRKAGKLVIVLDVPLLFESGMDQLVDVTIVVKVSKKIQMQRCLRQHHLSREQALQRIRRQWSMTQKVRRADIIVENGGTIQETEKLVKKIWEMINRRYRE
ncbi:MAG: dephospho-CoA kinase [Candidatus Omnitrophica bacterium]|nr:dephospho-CoA kinase [Candidatus Omnitrophota bacterium]